MKHLIKKLLREGLLNEGASPILYHFTYVDRLINILSTNTFYLTSNIGGKADQIGSDKTFFMSFSRSKSTKHGYGKGYASGSGNARIKIDGQKLSQNYKIKSVNYWQGLDTDEMEDRVVSNNDEIPNANKYIISIDILIGPDKTVNQKLIDLAKELNIKLYFFNNEKDFASGLPKRSVEPNIDDNDDEQETIYSNYTPGLSKIVGVLTYKNPEKYKEVLDVIGDQWKEEIDKYHSELKEVITKKINMHMASLISNLQGYLGYKSNKTLRYAIKELALDMRKNKTKTIKDYLIHKLYIGKKTQEDYNKELNNKIQNIIDNTFKKEIDKIESWGTVYDQTETYENLFQFKPAKEFITNKVKEIKKYVSDYVLTNNDMFKHNYKLGTFEIRNVLDLSDDNFEANRVANLLVDVRVTEILSPLQTITWNIDDFCIDEVERMQEEEMEQWRN